MFDFAVKIWYYYYWGDNMDLTIIKNMLDIFVILLSNNGLAVKFLSNSASIKTNEMYLFGKNYYLSRELRLENEKIYVLFKQILVTLLFAVSAVLLRDSLYTSSSLLPVKQLIYTSVVVVAYVFTTLDAASVFRVRGMIHSRSVAEKIAKRLNLFTIVAAIPEILYLLKIINSECLMLSVTVVITAAVIVKLMLYKRVISRAICFVELHDYEITNAIEIYVRNELNNVDVFTVNLKENDFIIGYEDNNLYVVPKILDENYREVKFDKHQVSHLKVKGYRVLFYNGDWKACSFAQ